MSSDQLWTIFPIAAARTKAAHGGATSDSFTMHFVDNGGPRHGASAYPSPSRSRSTPALRGE